MDNLFEIDDWKIIENGFDPSKQKQAESIFSIGNGGFGQRANFEEQYSGPSLQGSYVGGVYYPDKTRFGWWKNGYPEYFAKVLNSCNWIGINVEVDGETLDLNNQTILSFYRELDMKQGLLIRRFRVRFDSGKELEVESTRLCSMADDELAALCFSVTPLNFSGNVKFTPYLDGKVKNHDSNYDEFFWEENSQRVDMQKGYLSLKTKKTQFTVSTAMRFSFWKEGEMLTIHPTISSKDFFIENNFDYFLEQGSKYTLKKYISITSTVNHPDFSVIPSSIKKVREAYVNGFDKLVQDHVAAWNTIWEKADIKIDGDQAAQQAIRFNIFQLNQTYTGKNEKLNIGPKGFTGEKYGGAAYWDTEAYCLPFYLKTAEPRVARQLLIYRYNQLDKAIENAQKLGFKNGAALYPMVTMNGEECHNEWEITFEEIHRNGAIVFAIFNYIRHTGDESYLVQFGRPVIFAIARFWVQRFNWSEDKKAFVMLGVTGPNEYENNVNNNWYTSYLARWCIDYALEVNKVKMDRSVACLTDVEVKSFNHLLSAIYFPKIEGSNIFLQQDGFLDKEQITVDSIPESQRPLNQHWTWDRILRSIFIKQADVLQGIYLFEDHFDLTTIKDNFDFYEPKTVHESSLSPCIHSIIAAKIGRVEKACELYLRTSRLDLDDYNHEADEGLHITSMAGTWMVIVEGMAGIRVFSKSIKMNPVIPKNWKQYQFKILVRNQLLEIRVTQNECEIVNKGNQDIELTLFDVNILIKHGETYIEKSSKTSTT